MASVGLRFGSPTHLPPWTPPGEGVRGPGGSDGLLQNCDRLHGGPPGGVRHKPRAIIPSLDFAPSQPGVGGGGRGLRVVGQLEGPLPLLL